MFASQQRSTLISALLHAGTIALVLAITGVQKPIKTPAHSVLITPLDLLYEQSTPRKINGGGGGGVRAVTPASLGRLPRAALRQFTPPVVVPLNANPKLTMEPAILAAPDVALPEVNLAQFGDPNGVAGPASGGPGSGGGIGRGRGTGVGDGGGAGFGPGEGGGVTAAGRFEGAISPPVLLWKIEPEYTEAARRAKIQGTVELRLEVDMRGQTRNISVRRGLGLGLDECAVEAVKRWRFRPGYRNGKPLVTTALVEVSFRLL